MSKEKELKSKKRIIGIGVIAAIIVALSSITIYGNVIKPKKYDEYMNLGNQYLSEEKYDEATSSFEKAIKFDKDSINARLGAAKGLLGLSNSDKALEYLKEAQNLDMENEKLILEIISIIGDIYQDTANEMIKIFIDKVGINNVTSEFKSNILEATNKDEINSYIEKAQVLHDNAVEGSQEGQYKSGSKEELLSVIKAAKKINSNYLISQDEIDVMVSKLKQSINSFEDNKIKLMPKNLGSSYISRIQAIERNIDYRLGSEDLCNAEMGSVLEEGVGRYESVMKDIYKDLYKYLPSDKKSQLSSEKVKYENEKAKAEAELDEAMSYSPGTWIVTGAPEAMGEVVKEHCYYLINKYMK